MLDAQSDSGSRPFTQRVEVGSFYTDDSMLVEVTRVHDLGYIECLDSDGNSCGWGIDAFRRRFWLVAAAA